MSHSPPPPPPRNPLTNSLPRKFSRAIRRRVSFTSASSSCYHCRPYNYTTHYPAGTWLLCFGQYGVCPSSQGYLPYPLGSSCAPPRPIEPARAALCHAAAAHHAAISSLRFPFALLSHQPALRPVYHLCRYCCKIEGATPGDDYKIETSPCKCHRYGC